MFSRIEFILNDKLVSDDINPALPLLDYIRKDKHLHGTKEVCKEGDCGACTVLVGILQESEIKYKTVTSCIYPVGNVHGCHVVTIEGLNSKELIPQQNAFVDEGASQCGFCTPGFIVSLTGYLMNSEYYNFEDAVNAVGGNICRCTGYKSIERAIERTLRAIDHGTKSKLDALIEGKVIPEYFAEIPEMLTNIEGALPAPVSAAARIIGGGSDLFVQKPGEMLETDVAFSNRLDLNIIEEKDGNLYLGGAVTFEEFLSSEIIRQCFPRLPEQLKLVASLPIRNMATLAGNLANASPIGDLTIILLALGAELILYNNSIRRIVRLENFYLGYKTLDLHDDEVIEFIKFPIPPENAKLNFEKVSKRQYLDIASVNTAFYVEEQNGTISKARLSAGGIAPIPKLIDSAELLSGGKIEAERLDGLLESIDSEISPISDIRGSAEYKSLLLKHLIKAHFLELFPEQIEEGELV